MSQETQRKDSEPPPSTDERRKSERYLACFPADVEMPAGKTRLALIRDLSVDGALLLTSARVEVGETLKFRLYITPDIEHPGTVEGEVVRVEPLKDRSIWLFTVGVRFRQPATAYQDQIRELAERQTESGLTRKLRASDRPPT